MGEWNIVYIIVSIVVAFGVLFLVVFPGARYKAPQSKIENVAENAAEPELKDAGEASAKSQTEDPERT